MKKALVLMVLVMASLSAQANDFTRSPLDVTLFPFRVTGVATFSTGMVSSGWSFCKEAQQIIADGEEYALTGQLAPYLKQSVESLQAQSDDLSTDQAVDLLIEKAISILE